MLATLAVMGSAHCEGALMKFTGWTPGSAGTTYDQWDGSFPITDQGDGDTNGQLDTVDDFSQAPVSVNSQSPGKIRTHQTADASRDLDGKSYLRYVGVSDFQVELNPSSPATTEGWTSLFVQFDTTFPNGDGWDVTIGDTRPVAAGVVPNSGEVLIVGTGVETTLGWALFQLPGRELQYSIDIEGVNTNRIYENVHAVRVDTAYTTAATPLKANLVPEPASLTVCSLLGLVLLATGRRPCVVGM